MTDVRRKGSLAWYQNCDKSLRSIIPVHKVSPHMYFVKIGMESHIVDNHLYPVTLLQPVKHDKLGTGLQWNIKFSELKSKKVRRKDVIREINTEATTEEDLSKEVLDCAKLDVIGLSKGRGTLGPVQRRHIKMQKRKAAGSGVARKPGSMGTRLPGRVPYTKPFSGKTGFARRTIFGLKNLGIIDMKDRKIKDYYIKESPVLIVKGSVPGPTGRILCVRKSVRV